MKWMKLWSVILGLAAVLILSLTVKISFQALEAPVRIVTPSREAGELTETFMQTLCRADFENAGKLLLGQPKIDVGEGPGTQIGQLLWEAYLDSLSYEFTGELAVSDSGYTRSVEVTYLDISGVMALLKDRSQALLEEKAAAVDSDVALDENDHYREEFAMEVLREELVRILDRERVIARRELTLNLVRQNGKWWIVPDQDLARIFSGGMGK